MNCQSIVFSDDDFNDDHRCENQAQFRVSSDAGWTCAHCKTHTVQCVQTMLSQVHVAGYAIHVERVQ